MSTNIPDKLNVVQISQPVGIVYHHSLVFTKLDETAHLLLKALTVVIDGLFGHHASHVGSSGRIAYHSGSATDQCNRFVSCHLKPLHQAQSHEMPHMQTVCSRIKTDVKNGFPIVDQFLNLFFVCQLRKQPSCFQFIKYSHFSPPFLNCFTGFSAGNKKTHPFFKRVSSHSRYHLMFPYNSRCNGSTSIKQYSRLISVPAVKAYSALKSHQCIWVCCSKMYSRPTPRASHHPAALCEKLMNSTPSLLRI